MTSACELMCPMLGLSCRTDCAWRTPSGCAVAVAGVALKQLAENPAWQDLAMLPQAIESTNSAVNEITNELFNQRMQR